MKTGRINTQIIRLSDLHKYQRPALQAFRPDEWRIFLSPFNRPPLVLPAAYASQLCSITEGLDEDGCKIVIGAYHKASQAFRGIYRKNGQPYLGHLVETSYFLRTIMEIIDPVLLAAGLLHDIIEDIKVPHSELKQEFGQEVADLVDAETKLSKDLGKEIRDLESLKKWITALNIDPRVGLLKAADNLSNILDQEVFTPDKRLEHALETLEIYSRIMDAMGIWEMRVRLEDAAIRYADPEKYAATKAVYDRAIAATAAGLDELTTDMNKALRYKGLRPRIVHQHRTISEVFRKMNRTNKSLEPLLKNNRFFLDYLLVEIGGNRKNECYRALGIMRDEDQRSQLRKLADFKPRGEIVRDYLTSPRPNNYRALQFDLYQEGSPGALLVTITTKRLNNQNRLGLAALGAQMKFIHGWQAKNFDWLSNLLNLASVTVSSGDLRKLIGEVTRRQNIYSRSRKKVPMPVGSTALDFAVQDQPLLARNALQARVNGTLVGLDQPLRNNDTVEIITGQESAISPRWLSWVRTTAGGEYVRSCLRALPEKERTRSSKELLNEQLSRHYLEWDDISGSKQVRELLDQISQKHQARISSMVSRGSIPPRALERLTSEDLIYLIGLGEIDVRDVVAGFNKIYQEALIRRQAEKKMNTYAVMFSVAEDKIGIAEQLATALKAVRINTIQSNTRVGKDNSVDMIYVLEVYSTIQHQQVERIIASMGRVIARKPVAGDPRSFSLWDWRTEVLFKLGRQKKT